ncbi:MAG: cytochrome P450 [Pseudomonadota bacterium]
MLATPRAPADLVAPLFNPATFAMPGAIDTLLSEVRTNYPLAVAEVPGYDPHWIVTRHADIQLVSRKNDLFHNADRSANVLMQLAELLVQDFTGGDYNLFRSLVQLDGEEHRSHRMVLFKALSPAAITSREAAMRQSAQKGINALREGGGQIDFAEAVSTPYPLEVVLNLMGVPAQDHPKMLQLTQWLFSWPDPDLKRPGSDPTQPQSQTETWKIVFDAFDAYYAELLAQRRAEPRDDLVTLIAQAEFDGAPIKRDRAVSYCAILATAGHDSTAHSTATGMWMLAENPDLFRALKEDRSLIPNFVEEAIRWTTPVKHFVRHATEDTNLAGQAIKKGDRLYLAYPSGNRDDAEFDAPFEFRLDRKRNRHVGFGHGGHVCLGQHVARLEMRIIWEALLEALEWVEMDGPPRLIASEFVSGPKSVPIRYGLSDNWV